MKDAIKKNKKIILNAVFVVLILALTLYYVFKGEDLNAIIGYVKQADYRYLLVAIVFTFLFVSSESVIIHYLMNTLQYRVPLLSCIRYSFVGFFVSYITPSASGGQPAQMYFMHKDNMPVSVTSLVMMIIAAIYKFVLLVIAVFAFVFNFSFFVGSISQIPIFFTIGVFLNIVVIGALFFLIFKQSLLKKTVGRFIFFLGKKGIIKNYKKLLGKVLNAIKKYERASVYFAQHKKVFINVFFITLVQRIFLFLVTYLVYRSFGLKGTSAYEIVVLQTIIAIAVENLPLPGGMGITEGLYTILYANIMGSSLLIPSMILSRGISFYALLFAGCIITLISFLMKPKMIVKEETKELL